MYYISEDKQDLIEYDNKVSQGEKYDGQTTLSWANIVEHKDGGLFAILKHDKYPVELETTQDLAGWFDSELM